MTKDDSLLEKHCKTDTLDVFKLYASIGMQMGIQSKTDTLDVFKLNTSLPNISNCTVKPIH